MTLNYKPPQWCYTDGQTKRGRPLLLLSFDELSLANSFLQKKIKRNNWIEKKENYNQHLTDKIANQYVSETNLLLKMFSDIELLSEQYIVDLDKLNHNFNRIFTEEGWRKVRFEIRQMKKRTKLVRLEISKELFKQLQEIKTREKLDTTNDAIEYLIDHYYDSSQEFTTI